MKCKFCKCEMEERGLSLYCSKKCATRARNQRARNKELSKDKFCEDCGAVYHSKSKSSKYCESCREKRRKEGAKKSGEMSAHRANGSVDKRWLRRWGESGPVHLDKYTCFEGGKL